VCQNQAISSSNADIMGFVSQFLDSKESKISCDMSGFCLAAFDTQTLLTILAFKKDGFEASMSKCATCEFQDATKEFIKKTFDETNSYAQSLGMSGAIIINSETEQIQKTEPVKDRRGFLQAFNSKNIISMAKEINNKSREDEPIVVFGNEEVNYNDLRDKKLPAKREGFLAVLDVMNIKTKLELEPLFTTDKFVDDTCTNCELCYNLCPTSALSGARLKNAIYFESYKCIKCALCEDVCETKSIHSLPAVDMFDFAKKKTKELKAFKISRCVECGLVYPAINTRGVCSRCEKEDEDAMDLSGF
jgi:ferredoxin